VRDIKPIPPLITTVIIHADEVERMKMPREIPEQCEDDVDEEIRAATCYHEDRDGWKYDSEYNQEEEETEPHFASLSVSVSLLGE